MRAGLPVVVSNAGGAAEAVTDGVTGFVVAPGDREPLAERLRVLVREPYLGA
jgi:glycosyltransferase involved in cell wall biosynthesis